MPARGKLTVLGLYEYDPTLFESMELPEGVDSDITRHRILLEAGQLEVIYPDPAFLKEAIEWWSKANVARWGRLYATELLVYNPIWNVDGTETETIVRGLEETETEDRSREEDNVQVVIEDRSQTTEQDKSQTTEQDRSQTTEQDNSQSSMRDITVQNAGTNSMQGFNSTNMVGITGSADNSITSDDETITQDNNETITQDNNETITQDNNETITQDNTARTTQDNNTSESVSRERGQDETTTVTRRRTGNIGVTSTQSLIREQRELQAFSIYKLLADEFKQEFCLLVY